jgi:hypothetical protein
MGNITPTLRGASSGCGRVRKPPDMEGSCEYIEKEVTDSRQEMLFNFEVWAGDGEILTEKKHYSMSVIQRLKRLRIL